MHLTTLIKEIMVSEEIQKRPPVLVDIGASGSLHERWKCIAPYSICLAFDADNREFKPIEKENSGYKKLIVFNCIVSDLTAEQVDFHLTENPYCSSILQPDFPKLQPWIFSNLFNVKEEVRLKNISLKHALATAGIDYIDWFKTDSQGIDLRLFLSLGEAVYSKVKTAEFEPGIIDSYQGEDKLHELFRQMEQKTFYLSDMKVCGTNRLSQTMVKKYFPKQPALSSTSFALKHSPCWAELLYLNDFSRKEDFAKRDILLLALFSILDQQYGMALEVSDYGLLKYQDAIFKQIIDFCLKKINTGIKLSLKTRVRNKIIRLMEEYL